MRTVDAKLWIQINEVLQAYADAVDRGDVAKILTLFAPDGVWDSTPGSARKGHEEIGDFFRDRFKHFVATSHHVGPPSVRQNASDNLLESTAYFLNKHDQKDGVPYTIYGRFEDRFIASGDDLLIKHRLVIVHVAEGTSRVYNRLPRQEW
jgi:uncharacterized protein (TIGR02246 family)